MTCNARQCNATQCNAMYCMYGIRTCICTYVSMYLCTSIPMYLAFYVSICRCVYVMMHICICVYVFVYRHGYVRLYAHLHVDAHVFANNYVFGRDALRGSQADIQTRGCARPASVQTRHARRARGLLWPVTDSGRSRLVRVLFSASGTTPRLLRVVGALPIAPSLG